MLYADQFTTTSVDFEPMNIAAISNMVKDINKVAGYVKEDLFIIDDVYKFASIIWVLDMAS